MLRGREQASGLVFFRFIQLKSTFLWTYHALVMIFEDEVSGPGTKKPRGGSTLAGEMLISIKDRDSTRRMDGEMKRAI